jgi:chromosome segregation ATPase
MPNDNTDKSLDENLDNAGAESNKDSQKKNSDNHQSNTKNDESNSSSAKTFSEEYVKDLRSESARYRNQAKELQKKAEDAEAKANELGKSAETAQQEAKKALDETKRLQSAYEQRIIRAELKAAAVEEGLVDMDAFKMVDLSSVKIADDGEITGVKDLISNLKKEKPYLFKAVSTSNPAASAPPADANNGEKPVYKTPQELAEAKRKYLNSIR